MQFYHSIITEKSFKFLQELEKKYEFILIGGWAVFLYSHSLKSKDIDIIVDYKELARLKEEYDVFKNERLCKYEIKKEEIDVDIYLPYYSDLGINIGEIEKNTVSREGFQVPRPEMLLMLKLYAWESRRSSIKGQKDKIDIFSLVMLPEFDWKKYLKIVRNSGFEKQHKDFVALLKKTRAIKELQVNEQKMSKIRKSVLKFFENFDL